MTEAAKELKARLALLSPQERAELAQFLIGSLDEQVDPGSEAAWDAELARRASEIESGKAVGKPASQVFAELRDKYS